MTEERRIQLVAEVDATGARAGLNEISREAGTMSQAVARNGQQAEAAVAGIGAGAGRSAAQIESAARNLIGSIQRQTAALEAGARGSSTYFEAIARQRGIPLSTIEPLLAGLRQQEELQRSATAATEAGAAAQRSAVESAKAQAAAQRELAQAQAAGQNFLNGLREQIQLYGRSSDEILKYRAAQAGVAGAAAPLILQLQNQRAAHDAVATAARQQALAEQQATQVQGRRDGFLASLEQQAAAIGKTRSQLLELQAAQMGVTAQAAPFISRLREAEVGVARTGISAAQTANALRGVPAQFTDIITSLQGGQAPLTVLFQQGGQLRDMFGSAGGAARALGGYVLGLVTPFTVAAAAAGVLAYAHQKGSEEAKLYTRTLILTNNAAGATADSMAEAARRIGQISGGQGAAAAVIASLAESGKVPAENMQRFASVAVQAQQVIGRSVAETVQDFAALGKAPLTALDEINQKYHFITASTYAQVKALLDQGRAAEAADVAQRAYADGIDKQRQKVLDSLSDWERGWIRIKKAAAGALDSALDFGRGATNFEKINSLLQVRDTIESQLATARQTNDTKAVASLERQLGLNKDQINALRSKSDSEKAAATAAAKAVELEEAKTKWLKDGDQYLSRAAQLQRDVTKAKNEGTAAGASQADIDKRVSDIRKKYSDIENDGINSSIEALKRRQAVEDALTQRTIARITATKGLGATGEEEAINAIAKAEDDQFKRRIDALEDEKKKLKEKANSKTAQAAIDGQIDVLEEERITRRLQLGYDLQQQTRNSLSLYADQLDQLRNSRDSVLQQVLAQRDYNGEIGKTATELLALKAARQEEIAARLDARAQAADAEDLTGEKARIIREEAAAIRALNAEIYAGFVKQRDPYANLVASVKRYGDEASNVGGQIGNAMTNGFRSAEDAFVNFVTTGKTSFGSLATSIIADLARIQAKKALSGLADIALNSFFGSSAPGTSGIDTTGWIDVTHLPPRAAGGPVTGGASYLVGEKGPEIFTPSASGRIIANHAIGGGNAGGDINISTSVQITGGEATSQTSGDSSANGRALADLVNATVKETMAREARQGGLLWKMQQGRA